MKKIFNKLLQDLSVLAKKNFFLVFASSFMVKILNLCSSIVIVKLVEKESYGILTYSENIYSYFSLFTGIGLTIGCLRYVSLSKTKSTKQKYFKWSIVLGVLSNLFLIGIGFLYLSFANLSFADAKRITLLLLFTLIPSIIYDIFLSYLRANENNKAYALFGFSYCILFSSLQILLTLKFDIYGVIIAKYISVCLLIIIEYILIRRWHGPIFKNNTLEDNCFEEPFELKPLIVYSVLTLLSSVSAQIMSLNEIQILSKVFEDATLLADYRVACVVPNGIISFSMAIESFSFPYIARKSNDLYSVKQMTGKIILASSAMLFIICGIGFVCSKQIINIIYGKEYLSATLFMQLLWISSFINGSIRQPLINTLKAIGSVKFILIESIITSIVHLAISIISVFLFGAIGMCVSLIFIYLFNVLLLLLYIFIKYKHIFIKTKV